MKRWRGSYILRVVSVMSLSITGCLVASRSPAQTEILSYSGPNDATSGLLTGFGSSMAAGYFDDDSQLDLVVGAPSYGVASGEIFPDYGAAFVLHGPFLGQGTDVTVLTQGVNNLTSRLGAAAVYLPGGRDGEMELLGASRFTVGSDYNQGSRILSVNSNAGEWIVPNSNDGSIKYFGSVLSTCDINRDGYSDLAVRTGFAVDGGTSQVNIYLGGPGAGGSADLVVRPVVATNYFGSALAGVRDVTGDGIDDLLISEAPSMIHVVLGDTTFTDLQGGSAPVMTVGPGIVDDASWSFQLAGVRSIAGGYDVAGSAANDVVVGKSNGNVEVYEGPLSETIWPEARTTFSCGGTFGWCLAVDGDANGDGKNDLIIGDRFHTPPGTNRGRVTIALGGSRMAPGTVVCGNVPSTPSVWQLAPAAIPDNAAFGTCAGYIGDLDEIPGDEIFVSAPGWVVGGTTLGRALAFNLLQSDISITDEAAPIHAGPPCGGPHLLAVHVEAPFTIGKVYANTTDIGGAASEQELYDDHTHGDLQPGDGIYSAEVSSAIAGAYPRTVEVFARGLNVSDGFAVKDVQVPVLPSPLVAPIAEYPLSRTSSSYPMFAIRTEMCGEQAATSAHLTPLPADGFVFSQVNLSDPDLDGVWSYQGPAVPNIVPPPGFYDFTAVVYYGPTDVVQQAVRFQVIEPTEMSYVNKSSAAKLRYPGQPYSSVPIDFDQQGPPDMLVSLRGQSAQLFSSLTEIGGIPQFEIVPSTRTGGEMPDNLLGLAVADFDNDGRQDLFAASQTNARLYHTGLSTLGLPAFEDVGGAMIGADPLQYSITGTWGDYDRDGRVDLFVGRGNVGAGEPGVDPGTPLNGVLLHNETAAGGGFANMSLASGVGNNQPAYCVTAAWGDIDLDRFPDLFVGDASTSGTTSRLFWNNRNGTFTNEADTRLGVSTVNAVVAASFCDINNNGHLDLVLAKATGTSVRLNSGTGVLTQAIPIDNTTETSGMRVFDHNGDGVQDVLVLPANPAGTPELFKGTLDAGGLFFAPVTAAIGLDWPGKVGGSVVADFNADGDLDLFLGKTAVDVSNFFTAAGVEPTVDGNLQNWVRVALKSDVGGPNNYMGIGAMITVTQGADKYCRVVDGGSGRGGQDDGTLVIGLLSDATVSDITVTWPNGYSQVKAGAVLPNGGVPPFSLSFVDDTHGFAMSSVSGGYEIIPCTELSNWRFTWRTNMGTNPAFDRVVYKVGDPNLGSGGTTVLATDAGVSCTMVATYPSQYIHEIAFSMPCVLGQLVYYAPASANADGTLITGATRSFRITVCGTECLPEQ